LGGRRGASLAGARRQGEPSAFEEHRHRRRGVAAHQPIGAAMTDAHLAQAIEIAQQIPITPITVAAYSTPQWPGVRWRAKLSSRGEAAESRHASH
jgi:hypothetical protein